MPIMQHTDPFRRLPVLPAFDARGARSHCTACAQTMPCWRLTLCKLPNGSLVLRCARHVEGEYEPPPVQPEPPRRSLHEELLNYLPYRYGNSNRSTEPRSGCGFCGRLSCTLAAPHCHARRVQASNARPVEESPVEEKRSFIDRWLSGMVRKDDGR